MSTKVITGKVRLSWPNLFEPKVIGDDGKLKFSVMALIPKTDKKTVKALFDAEAQAKEEGKAKWGGKIPNNLKPSIIKDADEDGTAEDYPERAGHYYMSVSSDEKYRPGVVDQNVNPILDQTEIYSGVYARLSIGAFPYNNPKAKGVSFGLNHVQKMGDGAPLDGRTSAQDVFDAVDDASDDDLI